MCGTARFPQHLRLSILKLRKWKSEADRERLKLEVRLCQFVPLSLSFSDAKPDHGNGLLVVTPVINKPSRSERPSFIINASEEGDVFRYYYHAYRTIFDENETWDLGSVTPPMLKKLRGLHVEGFKPSTLTKTTPSPDGPE
jgi:hypothetical protein